MQPMDVEIKSDYITVGQLLKLVGAIRTGGAAKWFLAEKQVLVNGEAERRRGRKLYPNDLVSIEGVGQFRIRDQE